MAFHLEGLVWKEKWILEVMGPRGIEKSDLVGIQENSQK